MKPCCLAVMSANFYCVEKPEKFVLFCFVFVFVFFLFVHDNILRSDAIPIQEIVNFFYKLL